MFPKLIQKMNLDLPLTNSEKEFKEMMETAMYRYWDVLEERGQAMMKPVRTFSN